MDSIVSTRFKTSKSRIPVAIKNQKVSNENHRERSEFVSNAQNSKSHKATNPYFKKDLPKESGVKPAKTLNDRFRIKPKVQSSVSINTKSVGIKGNVLLPKTKQNIKNEQIKNNIQKKGDKEKDLSSLKNRLKSHGKEEKLSANKITAKSTGDLIEKSSKVMSEKENKTSDCFTAQKGIKFEANEIYRSMILRERELSPNVCNLLPGFRLSSIQSERPSIYQKLEVPQDPFKEVMRAIERSSLSIKRNEKSVKQFKIPSSPVDRGSFYTPGTNPKVEAMKSLERLKSKHLQKSALKSTKKVTFDLNIKEYTPNTCDNELRSFKSSENRLTQINEKSEENTPNSPPSEKMQASDAKKDKGNSPMFGFKEKDIESFRCQEVETFVETNNMKKHEWRAYSGSSTLYTPVSKTEPPTMDFEKLSFVQCEDNVFYSLKKTFPAHLSPNSDSKQNINETSINPQRTINFQVLEQKKMDDETFKIPQIKLYTPRPHSFYSNSNVMNSSSPEFLEKGTSDSLLKSAPICTPLVLKSVAKNTDLSPVVNLSPIRLKLDFSEKDTPRQKTPKKHTLVTLENIVTSKNKLDELADEECCLWLLNEKIPVVCGRYLINPVALTLTEGDEMHFIPIQF